MENLTHTLVGLMMARTGLEKTTVRGAGMMMLAANAPDIDAVFWFNRLHYLDYHRSYTHSLACAPVVALLPMVLARANFSWKSYAAATASVLSHLLLDWTNPYGIQLLLPFSHRRVMLDITNIADVWIWSILFAGLLVPLLAKKMKRAAGSSSSPRAAMAWIALSSLLTYEGARFAMHAKAVEMLDARIYRGTAPLEVIAVPADFAHPGRWKGIVRGARFATIVPLDVQAPYDSSMEVTYDETPSGEAIAIARKFPEFQTMLRFSQAPFWRTRPVSGGMLVELLDLRFGTPDDPGFAAVSGIVH